ncbi:MAG TPA: hypothetical protein VFS43_27450 [Polyangiaceae bacterium]|nr:hypothetical protein [Polyangiaceae bacterium]
MSGKSFGKTVLGWFVVQEDEPAAPAPTADELIAKYSQEEAPPADEPAPPSVELRGELPRVAAAAGGGGGVDFKAVYRAASISDDEQARLEKASGLLQTLPAETPKEVKRQIVEASLKAFGVPIDAIIEAGAQEIQALDAYIKHGERETQATLAQGAARIQDLERQIADVRRVMEDQVASQQALTRASNEEKLRVQAVLEFFGQEAVARVVRASPKLIEPA